MSPVSRKALVSLVLALALTGCPRQISRYDAGSPSSDGGSPGSDADSGDELSFEGPVALDDARVAQIDPSLLPAGTSPCRAPVLATVYHVADGDTISVRSENPVLDARVRLIGVDAPEIAHPPDQADCYGDEASTFTQQLLDHQVWLTFDNTCHDPYERLLAYVHVGSGDAGFWQRQLMRRGFARVLTVGDDRTYAPVFQRDEDFASMSRVGLWGACF
jgi:micrococcal nuclease